MRGRRKGRKLKQTVLWLLGIALLFPQGLPPVAQAASPPGTVVLHQSFEDGQTGGWMAKPWGEPGTVVVSEDQASDGTRSLKFTDRPSKNSQPFLDLTGIMVSDHQYNISLKVRLGESSGAYHVASKINSPKLDNPFPWIMGNQIVTDDGWTTFEIKGYEIPGDTTEVLIWIEPDESVPDDAAPDIYIDEVRIVDVTPDAGPDDPVDTSGITSDFEDGVQGWEPRLGSETVDVTSEANHTEGGAQSLKVTADRQYAGAKINALGKMSKNHRYELSAWVKMASGQPPTRLRISVQRGESSFDNVSPNVTVTEDGWAQLKGVYTLPSAPSILYAYIELADEPGEPVTFYVDDFRLAYIGPAEGPLPIQRDIPALKDVYADFFEIGAAVEHVQLEGEREELVKYHFNSLVAENSMKPGSINPQEGTYNFAAADALANYVRNYNSTHDRKLNLRFHTLLWHEQSADWMLKDEDGNWLEPTEENKRLILERLEQYLRLVVDRYKDVARDWDVVNEVIDESQPDGMRRSKWYELTGLDFIRTAFRVTREVAGPDAKLYINDYGTHNPKKRDFLFNLVTQLRAEGVPIDGVGHQTHINITAPSVDLIVESIRKFGEAGFDNQITELDVSVYTNNNDAYQEVPVELLNRQGYRYKELFEALKRVDEEGRQKGVPGGYISNVTFWGVADDHTWLHNRPITRQDAPFPFDKRYQAKPAYWGMVDPSKLPLSPKEGKAALGSAVPDGEMDFAWNLAAPMKTEQIGSLSAQFRLLWSNANLYVYVVVQDESVSPDDKVELFVYDNGARNKVTVSRGEPATRELPGGYAAETVIPLNHNAAVGDQVRFDLRITDSGLDDGSEHGKNGAIVSWSDPRNAQDEDEEGCGILTLAAAPKSAQAPYGTPVIDGQRDPVWDQAAELSTDVWVEGQGGATAKFRTLWDDQYLYVYAEVTDPLLSDASSNPWEQDSVEIFVDQNNGKTEIYEADDGQYRINYKNVRTVGGHASEDNYRSSVQVTETGYVVEAAIALDMITPQNGTVIGFDFQVNDDANGDGRRDSVAIWNDPSGQSYQDTSGLGVLELIGKPGDDPSEPGEDPSEPGDDPSEPGNGPSGPGGGQTGSADSGTNDRTEAGVVTKENGTVKITLKARPENGVAKTALTNELLQRALSQASADADGQIRIVVEIPAVNGASSHELQLPAGGLQGEETFILAVRTAVGTLEIPADFLAGWTPDDAGPVSLAVGAGSADGLDESLRRHIGHRPIVAVRLLVNGQPVDWRDPAAPVFVYLPYTPTPEERAKPDHLLVWHIDEAGRVTPIPGSRYDAADGMVRFRTGQLGTFVVVSVFRTFDDLAAVPWAREAVEAMASRDLISGMDDSTFNPKGAVTRAEFVALLVRALDLAATVTDLSDIAAFADVPSTDVHYREILIARKLGIAHGTDNGMFRPDAPVTRQEAMTLTARALAAAGLASAAGSADVLDAYADAVAVAAYARDAAVLLVSIGVVNGMNDRLEPLDNLTRAQAAVLLYRIWKL